jgi:transcriptional regulator with XRE-family HTH domain
VSEEFFVRETVFSGERLRIARDRVNMSQRDRARSLGEPRWQYQLREQEMESPRESILTPPEWCRLMRWRSTLSQGAIASAAGVSRAWLNRMEQGLVPCDTLLSYWGLDESKKTTEQPMAHEEPHV